MKPDEFICGDPEVFQDRQSTRPSAGCRAEGWVTFQPQHAGLHRNEQFCFMTSDKRDKI